MEPLAAERKEDGARLMSNRAIAGALGVDEGTVRNDQSGAEFSAPDDIPSPVGGLDGKTYRRPQRRPISPPTSSRRLTRSVPAEDVPVPRRQQSSHAQLICQVKTPNSYSDRYHISIDLG